MVIARKVRTNAATIKVILLFNAYYLKILEISFVMSVPIAYFVMDYYYSTFADCAWLSIWMFALAFWAVLLVNLTEVTLGCYKAASDHPVESIKKE